MAIPHRTRSHFDGQAILETGLDHPVGSSDGWLNRLLQVMSGRRAGIAIAAGMPLSLTGPYEVESWSPTKLGVVDDTFLERLAVLYRTDSALQGRFEAALQQQNLVGEEPMSGGNARRGAVTPLCRPRPESSVRNRARTSPRWSSAVGTRTPTREWLVARWTACSDSLLKGSSHFARRWVRRGAPRPSW